MRGTASPNPDDEQGHRYQLWRVALDGTAVLEGTYPAPPANQLLNTDSAKLDSRGRVYDIVFDIGTNDDQIIRRSLDGEVSVIYSELRDDPVVRLHGSTLFTGP